MKNIICVKWGNLYSSAHVNALYAMAKRNLTLSMRFICLTDDTTGLHHQIDAFPLKDKSLRGWWSKIAIFENPLVDISGPILFLDLDTAIVSNIDDMFEYKKDNFIMNKDYPHHAGLNSNTMRFEAGKYSHIYDDLDLSKIDHSIDNAKAAFKNPEFWGDQIWIAHQMKKDPCDRPVFTWPDGWVSKYGLDCHWDPTLHKQFSDIGRPNRTGPGYFKLPPDTKIITFNGYNNRPDKYLNNIGEWWHTKDIDE